MSQAKTINPSKDIVKMSKGTKETRLMSLNEEARKEIKESSTGKNKWMKRIFRKLFAPCFGLNKADKISSAKSKDVLKTRKSISCGTLTDPHTEYPYGTDINDDICVIGSTEYGQNKNESRNRTHQYSYSQVCIQMITTKRPILHENKIIKETVHNCQHHSDEKTASFYLILSSQVILSDIHTEGEMCKINSSISEITNGNNKKPGTVQSTSGHNESLPKTDHHASSSQSKQASIMKTLLLQERSQMKETTKNCRPYNSSSSCGIISDSDDVFIFETDSEANTCLNQPLKAKLRTRKQRNSDITYNRKNIFEVTNFKGGKKKSQNKRDQHVSNPEFKRMTSRDRPKPHESKIIKETVNNCRIHKNSSSYSMRRDIEGEKTNGKNEKPDMVQSTSGNKKFLPKRDQHASSSQSKQASIMKTLLLQERSQMKETTKNCRPYSSSSSCGIISDSDDVFIFETDSEANTCLNQPLKAKLRTRKQRNSDITYNRKNIFEVTNFKGELMN